MWDINTVPIKNRSNKLIKYLFQAKKSHTVETNLKNINMVKLDLEFEVDPLFSKTSAAFDEGGTGGLMMNHLQVQTISA